MATKVIQWNEGTGNITLTYTGEGDGTIVVSSDQNNLSVARSQQITVKTTDGSKSQTVTISQAAYVRNYLKFTALESGTFTLTIPASVTDTHLASVSYSLDNGATWVTTQNSSSAVTITTPTVAQGGTVLWKGSGTQMATSASVYSNFSSTGSFQASGNIMSLLYQDTFEDEKVLPNKTYTLAKLFLGCTGMTTPPELPATTLRESCYRNMFDGCTSLTEAPELPALDLVRYCYQYMFSGCTSLTTMPELPATTTMQGCYQYMFSGCTSLINTTDLYATNAANACYYYMFYGCTSLVTAPKIKARTYGQEACRSMFLNCASLTTIPEFVPETITGSTAFREMFKNCTSLTVAPALPATTLTAECYRNMFQNCTSLTVAPDLPATTLASSCYNNMFRDCGNLNYIKCLATDISASSCTTEWLRGVSANGTFVKNSEMSSWATGNSGIPSGWTVENVARNYLKFTALESGTFTLTIPASVTATHLASISYSLDNGATWFTTQNTSSAVTITTPTVAEGGTVLWKGSGSQTAMGQNSGQYSVFSSTGNFRCDGNVMSLLYEDNFENQVTLTKTYCFCRLFYNCTTITTMPQLPATTLTSNCYSGMFYGCSSLVNATKLPATTLQERCYDSMFHYCDSLTNIPQDMIAAETLGISCCYRMFYSCVSMTSAPWLLAPTLRNNCYQQMFTGCKNLSYIKCLATNITATDCTTNWVNVVAARGTFIKAAEMTSWPTGRSGIPSGWTVEDADD
jgi:hypothetical protein